MAEQLDLHYIYEEDSELINQPPLTKLVLEDLQDLLGEWLDEFLTTVRLGDTEAMLILTNTLTAEHAETKVKLEHCISDFELKYLINILEENKVPMQKT